VHNGSQFCAGHDRVPKSTVSIEIKTRRRSPNRKIRGDIESGSAMIQKITSAEEDVITATSDCRMASTRLTLENGPDGISLDLAPVGAWALVGKTVPALTAVVGAVLLANVQEYFLAGLAGLFALVQLVVFCYLAKIRSVFTVNENRLQVVTFLGQTVPVRRLQWPRDEIVAVNSCGGLRVITAAKEQSFFLERDPEEIDFVASVLRQALHVPDDVPPRTGELRVHFTGPLWPHSTPGILGFRAGELTLRTPLMATPLFFFRARSGPHSQWVHSSLLNIILLEPHEIVGRLPHGERGKLVIAPTTPLLLRRNYTIPPGIVGRKLRTILFWKRISFHICCDNGDSLQTALACFWTRS
jgi:hypothetical protein